jgi:molybdopterin-guanine dinucleotide biosynthesis protein MobB
VIRVFRFVGHSGTGKTTLLERIIPELARRGLRVAVAKDTHHTVELDQPGKDSFRLRAAGADQVVLSTDGQLTLFERRSERASLDTIVDLVRGRADILLVEGYRDEERFPAVLVWRALGGALPSMRGVVVATVSDEPRDLEGPAFRFDDVVGLVELLLAMPLVPG